MEFYSSGIGNSEYTSDHRVYFGLDTIIRSDVSDYVSRTDYTLSLDFNYLVGNPSAMYAGTWADCAAVIPKGGMPWLWENYLDEHRESGIGRSTYPMHVWVTHQLVHYQITPALWQELYPALLCSYKWPSPKIDEPEEPMIFFHGQPQIHEVLGQAKWINKYWHCEGISIVTGKRSCQSAGVI